MPVSYLDFEDANLAGMAEFERWRVDFESAFIQPAGDEIISALWQTMTPAQREMLRQMNPEAIESIEKRITKAR